MQGLGLALLRAATSMPSTSESRPVQNSQHLDPPQAQHPPQLQMTLMWNLLSLAERLGRVKQLRYRLGMEGFLDPTEFKL